MRLLSITATLAAALMFTGSAHALPYAEVGDAGQTMATAQVPSGSGALGSIQGMLGDYVDSDMFKIRIDGGAFSANTLGSSISDPMLHLYNPSGTRVLFNDDYFGLQSNISSSGLAAGDYYLAISYWSNGYNYQDASNWTTASYEGRTAYTINLTGASFAEPVPEPSTFLLLGAGFAGMALARRRQRLTREGLC